MAKKILCIIVLVLTLICVFTSCGHKHQWSEWETTKEATSKEEGIETRNCSCGEKETRAIEQIAVTTTVSSIEWRKALDLKKSNVTIYYDYHWSEESNDVYGVKGTVLIENGTAYAESQRYHNDAVTEEDSWYDEDFEGLEVLDLGEFWYEIEYLDDLGYSMFRYDEDVESYCVEDLDIDGVLFEINMYFEDTKLVKITLEGADGSYTESSVVNFSYK